MSWQTELTTILRVLVNDSAGTLYSDTTLQTTLAVAARQVGLEMTFSKIYVVTIADPLVITPDPTDDIGLNRDDSFNNLTTLKAACIIDHGAAILAAKQAIAVKDGSSSIDLRGIMLGKLKLLEKGWCAVYDDAKLEYKLGAVVIAGAAVMTPFRLFAQSNSGVFGFGTPTVDRWGRSSIY